MCFSQDSVCLRIRAPASESVTRLGHLTSTRKTEASRGAAVPLGNESFHGAAREPMQFCEFPFYRWRICAWRMPSLAREITFLRAVGILSLFCWVETQIQNVMHFLRVYLFFPVGRSRMWELETLVGDTHVQTPFLSVTLGFNKGFEICHSESRDLWMLVLSGECGPSTENTVQGNPSTLLHMCLAALQHQSLVVWSLSSGPTGSGAGP